MSQITGKGTRVPVPGYLH